MKLHANWIDVMLCAALTVAGSIGVVWMYFLMTLDDPNARVRSAIDALWKLVTS